VDTESHAGEVHAVESNMQAVRDLLLGETFGCPFEQSDDVVQFVEARGYTLKCAAIQPSSSNRCILCFENYPAC